MNAYGVVATVIICATVITVCLAIIGFFREVLQTHHDRDKLNADQEIKLAQIYGQRTPAQGLSVLPKEYPVPPAAPAAPDTEKLPFPDLTRR